MKTLQLGKEKELYDILLTNSYQEEKKEKLLEMLSKQDKELVIKN